MMGSLLANQQCAPFRRPCHRLADESRNPAPGSGFAAGLATAASISLALTTAPAGTTAIIGTRSVLARTGMAMFGSGLSTMRIWRGVALEAWRQALAPGRK